MIEIERDLSPTDLLPELPAFWELSGAKIWALEAAWDPQQTGPLPDGFEAVPADT